MIQYHEALDLIHSNADPIGSEKVELLKANMRVLAEDLHYDGDMPPFNKSAMDGFACRRQDMGKVLSIVETVLAGQEPKREIGENECARIMTGAVIPEGADCVFMKEVSELKGDDKVICLSPNREDNICYKGEDVHSGDLALKKGTLINSKNIPLLAGAGAYSPLVYIQPEVSVFSTGTELVEPNRKPMPYQIRNSNSYQLMAQLEDMGIMASYKGIIQDDENETEQKISEALGVSRLVLLSGGVSMGDSDFIPHILQTLEFEIILSTSAIQPGKPIIFARKKDQFIFGLAGNPVSSFVQLELYVKPFIYRCMGHHFTHSVHLASLSTDYSRKRTDRLKFIPASVNEKNEVSMIDFHGSAHIAALQQANCLVEVPMGVSEIKKGELVYVRPV